MEQGDLPSDLQVCDTWQVSDAVSVLGQVTIVDGDLYNKDTHVHHQRRKQYTFKGLHNFSLKMATFIF